MKYKKSLVLLSAVVVLPYGLLASATVRAGNEQVLYDFSPASGNRPDGEYPRGPLISDARGHLYGTTYDGGVYNRSCHFGNGGGCGTVFELIPRGNGEWTEKLLHIFEYDEQDGTNPDAGLIFDAWGNLYGTTVGGGTGSCIVDAVPVGCGTVFELSRRLDGDWDYTVVHNFTLDGGDGYYPHASLTLGGDGNMYGTTFNGGSNCVPDWGCGTVFEMYRSRDGQWREKVLYSFCNGNGTSCPDGVGPDASLIFDPAGNLYGTTFAGGNVKYDSYGTVFELHHSGDGEWTEEVLFSFDLNDGAYPVTSLVLDAEGNLYGTTSSLAYPYGAAVFELTRCSNGTWKETVLHAFSFGNDSISPSNLVFDKIGNLYGLTGGGRSNYYYGTIFRLTRCKNSGWTEEVLYTFDYVDGAGPNSLVFDATGDLYGTTNGGGTGGLGTVWKFTM